MHTYTEADIRRFYTHVAVGKPDECWEWLSYTNKEGYGKFGFDHKVLQAHRFAFWFTTGVWPGDLKVCHHCDNPGCVNPAHLWRGTDRDNSHDSVEKGRMHLGESHGNSKLIEEDVLAIRAQYTAGVTTQQLADEYGVERSCIYKIVNRINWSHV